MSEFQYNDILNMQYPNPEIEKDFPDKILRAAQFAPFAALTGHDEAIKETARLTERKIELGENTKNEIEDKIRKIRKKIAVMACTLKDSKKKGRNEIERFCLFIVGAICELSICIKS